MLQHVLKDDKYFFTLFDGLTGQTFSVNYSNTIRSLSFWNVWQLLIIPFATIN